MYAERKAPKTKAPKTVESINIKKAENGFIVRCSHPPTPSKGNGPVAWEPDKEYAFSTLEEAKAFVDKSLG